MDGGWGTPYNVAEGMGSAPWHNAAQDYMPKADISYTTGKHAMKFGFSYNRYTKNQQLFGNVMGTVGFGKPDQRQHDGHAARHLTSSYGAVHDTRPSATT